MIVRQGVFTAGGLGHLQVRANMVKQFHDNNNKAIMNNQNNASIEGGGSPDLAQSLSGKAGSIGASAIGVDPSVGSLLGQFLGGQALNIFSKKEDDRPGQRDSEGWGVKPSDTIDGFEWTYNGDEFWIGNWGKHRSFWKKDDNQRYTGYQIKRNGEIIADNAVYVWIEGNRLFVQNNLTPWEDQQTAGGLAIYTGLPGSKVWEFIGEGEPNQPKAMNKKKADTFYLKDDNRGFSIQGENEDGLNFNVQNGNNNNRNGFVDGSSPPLVGGDYMPDFDTKKEGEDKEEEEPAKKDNTLLYVGIGVGAVLLITIAFITISRNR